MISLTPRYVKNVFYNYAREGITIGTTSTAAYNATKDNPFIKCTTNRNIYLYWIVRVDRRMCKRAAEALIEDGAESGR